MGAFIFIGVLTILWLIFAYLWFFKKEQVIEYEDKIKRHLALKWMAQQGYVIKKIGDDKNV